MTLPSKPFLQLVQLKPDMPRDLGVFPFSIPAMRCIDGLEFHPDVTFLVFGHQPYVISEHVPERRLKRLTWMPQHEYPLGLVGVDIGCCPLEDRPFNRCKTPIKAWEYALSGAAVVASPTVYGQCISSSFNGWLGTTAR